MLEASDKSPTESTKLNPYPSHTHAIKKIKTAYEQGGFKIDAITPGEDIAQEFDIDLSQTKHGGAFAFIDEYIFILKNLSHFYTGAMTKQPEALISLHFCDATVSTITAIRLLSGAGLDTSARVQLRYLYELSILWSRALVDPDLLAALKNCKSFEDTNPFWHQFLAKQKTEKFLAKTLQDQGIQWLGLLGDGKYLKSIHEKLGWSAHPGSMNMKFNSIAAFSNPTNNMALSSVDLTTIFTLDSTIFLTAAPFSFAPPQNNDFKGVELFEPGELYPQHQNAATWKEYIDELQKIIPLLFIAYLPIQKMLAEKMPANRNS